MMHRRSLLSWLGVSVAGAINPPWGLPVAMSATALALHLLNRHSERPYRWWHTFALPAAGFLWMSLDSSQGEGDLPRQFRVFVIAGLWLSAQGAWTLYGYLRNNPGPPAGEGLQAGTGESRKFLNWTGWSTSRRA